MWESLVGVENPATRQKVGKPVIGVVEPGGVNDPLVIDCAVVIVVLGNVRLARSEQESAAADAAMSAILASRAEQNNHPFKYLWPPECL